MSDPARRPCAPNEKAKRLGFGIYKIEGALDAETEVRKACTVGRDLYKSVQTQESPCACTYKYAASSSKTRELLEERA